MGKMSVTELPLAGKRVLIRVDFNVPMKNGIITDDTRIRAALKTIQYVLDEGGQPILMSHLGRPKGKVVPELSLKPIAGRLAELLGVPVTMEKGDGVVLLENLRFNAAETKPELDPEFARQLAALGDVYVNDAFGTAHRAHSSTVKVAEYFPGRAAAGFLLQKEIEFLGREPKHPFAAVVGGAKVSSKLGVLKALLEKADLVLIGGAMAYTFLVAQGVRVGTSLVEPDLIEVAKELLRSPKIHLPVDTVIAPEIREGVTSQVIDLEEGIPPDQMGVDVGPKTIEGWRQLLAPCQTILWNGPLGVFEVREFATGTFAMADILSHSSATTIVGGGDSVAAVNRAGLADRMDHVSTGGGASLEYIEKGSLPGIDALSESVYHHQ